MPSIFLFRNSSPAGVSSNSHMRRFAATENRLSLSQRGGRGSTRSISDIRARLSKPSMCLRLWNLHGVYLPQCGIRDLLNWSSSLTPQMEVSSSIWGVKLELQFNKRSEEHTSELQSPDHLVCRLLLEKKKDTIFFDNIGDITLKLKPKLLR